jgi:hypothetical protein
MEDNEEPVLPQTQVRDMCDRITCKHTAVIIAVTNVRTGRDDNGQRYCDSLTSKYITEPQPDSEFWSSIVR